MPGRIRILLADDHAIVRQGSEADPLRPRGFGSRGRGFEWPRSGGTSEKLRPDIVLMDVQMPELNGIEATKKMVAANARLRILVLSMHKEAVYVREILRAGARGYILKDAIDTELLSAVRFGGARRRLYQSGCRRRSQRQTPRIPSNPLDRLSPREREVLLLIAEGKTNKEIATHLNLSVYTVDSHRGKIMEKLNLHSAGELVRFAMKNGLVD